MAGRCNGSAALDVKRANTGVWLLKFPSSMAAAWDNATGNSSIGKVTCTWDLLNPDPKSAMQYKVEIPVEGRDVKTYNLNRHEEALFVPSNIFSDKQGKLGVEGKVTGKFDITPNTEVMEQYRQVCRERENVYNTKTRHAQRMPDGPIHTMVPSMQSKDLKRRGLVAAKKDNKRFRGDRTEVENAIFKMFERGPRWNLKQLMDETDQPAAFLREILNEICTYNRCGSNRGTYELKLEYMMVANKEKSELENVNEEKPKTTW